MYTDFRTTDSSSCGGGAPNSPARASFPSIGTRPTKAAPPARDDEFTYTVVPPTNTATYANGVEQMTNLSPDRLAYSFPTRRGFDTWRQNDSFSDTSTNTSPAWSSSGESFEEAMNSSSTQSFVYPPEPALLSDYQALTTYSAPHGFLGELHGRLQDMSLHLPGTSSWSTSPTSPGSQGSFSPLNPSNPEVASSGPSLGNANEHYDVDNDPSLFDFDFDMAATQYSNPPGLVQYQSGSPSVPATQVRSAANQVPEMNYRRPRPKRGRNKEASLRRTKKATHICPECNYTFTTSARMRDHVNSEHHDLDIRCDLCPRKFRHTTSLRRHRRDKHPEPTSGS